MLSAGRDGVSAGRDNVVGRAGRCCRRSVASVVSASGWMPTVRLYGLTTASLLSDAAIASSGVAFSSLCHCCSV